MNERTVQSHQLSPGRSIFLPNTGDEALIGGAGHWHLGGSQIGVIVADGVKAFDSRVVILVGGCEYTNHKL